jgi:hypothetical protein
MIRFTTVATTKITAKQQFKFFLKSVESEISSSHGGEYEEFEAASTSETSVNFYETTRRNIP